MLVVNIFTVLFIILPIHGKCFIRVSNQDFKRGECLSEIVKTYFFQYKEITLVELTNNYDNVIKDISSDLCMTVMLDKIKQRGLVSKSYLILADNIADFSASLQNLTEYISWNPEARFLILINVLLKNDLQILFDVLLKYHIINVLVMDGSRDSKLYTYNPFENYGCGFRYDKIIEFGKCSNIDGTNLYPNKLITGLKKCPVKVMSFNWPPFSMDPAKEDIKLNGIEGYIMRELGFLEGFIVNTTYINYVMYPTAHSNFSAIRMLRFLQEGNTDIVLGGLALTSPRINNFGYIHGHLAYVDEVRFLVKKASYVSIWKYLYLALSTTVWMAFLLALILFFLFFIISTRSKDKSRVLLGMLASLYLNSYKISGNNFKKRVFIGWVWFAFLINIFYQSGLVSLMNHPVKDYQISNEEDIVQYNLKPCIGKGSRSYFLSIGTHKFENQAVEGCDSMIDDLDKVCQSKEIYTLVPNLIYEFWKYKFYDDSGHDLLYAFRKPFNKAIYAIYTYKGFPLLEKLQIGTLRLRENGLISFHMDKLFWHNIKNYYGQVNKIPKNFFLPWHILVCGYLLSLAIFFIEIFISRFKLNICSLVV